MLWGFEAVLLSYLGKVSMATKKFFYSTCNVLIFLIFENVFNFKFSSRKFSKTIGILFPSPESSNWHKM